MKLNTDFPAFNRGVVSVHCEQGDKWFVNVNNQYIGRLLVTRGYKDNRELILFPSIIFDLCAPAVKVLFLF